MSKMWDGTGRDEHTPPQQPPWRRHRLRRGALGAGPPHGSSRPAGPYAVRLTSRRTDAARAREKGEAASLRSPPPFCLCTQGGHGAPSFSVPVVSGEDGTSSFSFHLRFLPHSFLFPEGTKQQGNGGDAGRGGGVG